MQTNIFAMSLSDYLAYNHYYQFSQSWAMRIIMFGSLAAILVFSLTFYLVGNIDYAMSGLLTAAVLAVYYFLFLGYIFPLWGYAAAKKRGDYGQPCVVKIDGSHIVAQSDSAELRKPWRSIERIVDRRSHLFICFNKCNAFIIPKTAFDSPVDAENFQRMASHFLAVAKAGPQG